MTTLLQRPQTDALRNVAGLHRSLRVHAATTAPLPSRTYADAAQGQGATLTADAAGALPSQDGVALVAGMDVLVKDEPAGQGCGVYTVGQAGDSETPWVLVRRPDWEQGCQFPGGFVAVLSGTTNGGKPFYCTNTAPPTLLTDAVDFQPLLGSGGGGGGGPTTEGEGVPVYSQVLSGAVDGTNTDFTAPSNFQTNTTAVFVAGARQVRGTDYVEVAPSVVRFALAPQPGPIALDMMADYVVASPPDVYGELAAGAIDGANATFTTAYPFDGGSTRVWLNRVRQYLGVHYDEAAPNQIVFRLAPQPSGTGADSVVVDYSAAGAPQIYGEAPSGAVDGTNTDFVLADTIAAGSTRPYFDGVRQHLGVHYIEVAPSTIRFLLAPQPTPNAPNDLRVDYGHM